MESLLNLASEVFGVSGDKLGELASAICDNVELSSLLASSGCVTGREKPKRVSDVSRCEALVWMLERNALGVWVPKRCTRGCVEGDVYCKNHGARVNKRCDDCSSFQGCDVVHEFKHDHLGTISRRSFVIDKFWDVLVKKSEAACCVKDGSCSSSSEVDLCEKRSLSSSSKKLVVGSSEKKPLRVVDNPFMNWLSAHRGEIKVGLLSDGVVVSGRELTTLVSKRGGEMWRALSKEDQQEWKGKKLSSSSSSSLVEVCDDVLASDDTVSSVVVDDDAVRLIFNKDHSVWVDDETGLYYGSDDVESAPLGQLSGGKLVAFKKSGSKK
jgi:hypothetical protein